MSDLLANLDPARALLLARASRAAYFENPDEVAACLAASHVQGQTELFQGGDTGGFLFSTDALLIVSFRGSVTLNERVNTSVELVPWRPVLPEDFAVACTGLSFDKQGKLRAQPSGWLVALTMLDEILSRPDEQWMDLAAHGKDGDLRLAEAAFPAK